MATTSARNGISAVVQARIVGSITRRYFETLKDPKYTCRGYLWHLY